MPIQYIDQDITTQAGWDDFVRAMKKVTRKGALDDELEFAQVILIVTRNPINGTELRRPAFHVLAGQFTGATTEEVDRSKGDFNFIARAWAVAGYAIASIFISEGWMSTVSAKDGKIPADIQRPSVDPARREVVLMTTEHRDFAPVTHHAEILSVEGKRDVAPWSTLDGGLEIGRFGKFVPPPTIQDNPIFVQTARDVLKTAGADAWADIQEGQPS